MPGYQVRETRHAVGGHVYRLRVPGDKRQFADPDGHGARSGMSSAQGSLFDRAWPAGWLLAQAMQRYDVAGKRILELGCGIGQASLVLQQRGADAVATDAHPRAAVFLVYNAALNGQPALHYRLRWDTPLPALGRSDVIASDMLYERDSAERPGTVIERHALPRAEVLIAGPGRGDSARFTRWLGGHGFDVEAGPCPMDDADPPPHRGRLPHYRRGADA